MEADYGRPIASHLPWPPLPQRCGGRQVTRSRPPLFVLQEGSHSACSFFSTRRQQRARPPSIKTAGRLSTRWLTPTLVLKSMGGTRARGERGGRGTTHGQSLAFAHESSHFVALPPPLPPFSSLFNIFRDPTGESCAWPGEKRRTVSKAVFFKAVFDSVRQWPSRPLLSASPFSPTALQSTTTWEQACLQRSRSCTRPGWATTKRTIRCA